MIIAVDLAVVAILSAVWLTAGVLADALPETATARALRRRTATVLALVGAGIAVLLAAAVLTPALPGSSAGTLAVALPAIPAALVLVTSVRRLAWLRRGATAFAAAPDTPTPPALRAAAAHPLLAMPPQVTALAAVAGAPIAAGLVTPADLAGLAVTFVVLAIGAIGVRHALRHSRLAEGAVRVRVRAISRSA